MQTEVLWIAPTLAILVGYVLGSIPFGMLLTRLAGAGDLRAVGSGNIGATNVLRTGHRGLAAATLLLDVLKGAAAVWIAHYWWPGNEMLAAAAAFLGHCYPVWLRFRGGKGVATLMGVSLAIYWPIGLVYAAVWIGLLALLRISSLAGLVAAASTPISAALLGRFEYFILFIVLAGLVLWKHGGNIERLLAGTEPRIGGGGTAEPAEPTHG